MQQIPENIIQKSVHPSSTQALDYVVSTKTDDSRGTRKKNAEVGDSTDKAVSLFKRLCDSNIIPRILFHSNLPTVLTFRLVSKEFYKLAGSFIAQDCTYKSPLMVKALISFTYAQIKSEIEQEIREKYDFAINHTGMDISISLDDFIHHESIKDRFNFLSNNAPSITFGIKTFSELNQLNTLLSSVDLKENQKLILKQIKSLDLSEIPIHYYDNIADINQLLILIGSELKTLKFGKISADLILPSLPKLTTLKFKDINAILTLPKLPQLTSFSFGHIDSTRTENINLLNALAQAEDFPKLRTLEFGDIKDALTLQTLSIFSKLTTLKFGDINIDLTLPSLPKIEALQFSTIQATLTLTGFPELKVLKFGNIYHALTLPSFPNLRTLSFCWLDHVAIVLSDLLQLTTLEFGDVINSPLTLPNLPELRTLSFRNISFTTFTLTLSNLQKLTTLLFGDVFDSLELSNLPELTTLEFKSINTPLILPEFPRLTKLKFGSINHTLTLTNSQFLEFFDPVQLKNKENWLVWFCRKDCTFKHDVML